MATNHDAEYLLQPKIKINQLNLSKDMNMHLYAALIIVFISIFTFIA